MGFPGGSAVKNQPAMQEVHLPFLEKEIATHSSILAWKIPWTEKPGGYSLWGHKESDRTERLTLALSCTSPWHCRVSHLRDA